MANKKNESDVSKKKKSKKESIVEETVEDEVAEEDTLAIEADAEEEAEEAAVEEETATEEDSEEVEEAATEEDSDVEEDAKEAAEETIEDESTTEEIPDVEDAAEGVDEEETVVPAVVMEDDPAVAKAREDKKIQNNIYLVCVIVTVILIAILFILANRNTSDIVAKVGERVITQEMVDREAALIFFNNTGQPIESLTAEELEIYKNQILVFFLVQAEAVKEYLHTEGIGELSEEQIANVTANVDAYYERFENAEEVLAGMGITRADVQYFAEINEYMYIYQGKALQDNPVTDAEVEQFYNENSNYFVLPPQRSASHILIADADHTPEKRAEIEAILARILEGEDFAELAKEFSDDGSAASGGDLGYFGEDHGFVPEFGAAALALENVGDVSEIIETQFGYHIIKLTDKQAESLTPLDSVGNEIMYYLAGLRIDESVIELVESFVIEYFIPVDPETGVPPIDPPTS